MNKLLERITETILNAILGNDEWNENDPYFVPADVREATITPPAGKISLNLADGTVIHISVTVTKVS